jgi:hypothetical protein
VARFVAGGCDPQGGDSKAKPAAHMDMPCRAKPSAFEIGPDHVRLPQTTQAQALLFFLFKKFGGVRR